MSVRIFKFTDGLILRVMRKTIDKNDRDLSYTEVGIEHPYGTAIYRTGTDAYHRSSADPFNV